MISELAAENLVEQVDDTDEDSKDDNELESPESTDNIGDPSVEINVEELISELEADGLTDNLGDDPDTRKRLEELMERKRALHEVEDFDDYDI